MTIPDTSWVRAAWDQSPKRPELTVLNPTYRAEFAERRVEEMLERLHICALAEDRVRARHRPVESGMKYPWCSECGEGCSVCWPCPTLEDMIGPL